MVIIKRYPNRRLYDTGLSSYITLNDVADRVRRGEPLKVVDAKTNEDLTRRVLTQVVLEQARRGGPGPPVDFLRHLILASDPELQDFLNWYLGQALEAYQRMKNDWRNHADSLTALDAPAPSTTKPTSLADEMQELRRRMEEMEQRFKGG